MDGSLVIRWHRCYSTSRTPICTSASCTNLVCKRKRRFHMLALCSLNGEISISINIYTPKFSCSADKRADQSVKMSNQQPLSTDGCQWLLRLKRRMAQQINNLKKRKKDKKLNLFSSNVYKVCSFNISTFTGT